MFGFVFCSFFYQCCFTSMPLSLKTGKTLTSCFSPTRKNVDGFSVWLNTPDYTEFWLRLNLTAAIRRKIKTAKPEAQTCQCASDCKREFELHWFQWRLRNCRCVNCESVGEMIVDHFFTTWKPRASAICFGASLGFSGQKPGPAKS